MGSRRKREARYAFAPELWKKLDIRDASSSRRITAGERGVALGLGKWTPTFRLRARGSYLGTC